jgi:ABC-2 type transport system ATP-binding protein
MGEYILRTKDLSKKYESVYAIENINVEIKQGQIYGLIGLNGAGKSTFIRAVTGLITITSGEVELFGKSAAFG